MYVSERIILEAVGTSPRVIRKKACMA
jgi:hypothetical protein